MNCRVECQLKKIYFTSYRIYNTNEKEIFGKYQKKKKKIYASFIEKIQFLSLENFNSLFSVAFILFPKFNFSYSSASNCYVVTVLTYV